MKKIVLVIPYFGTFPNYIQLWLNSCSQNPNFTWVLITDCDYKILKIPKNVIVIESKLDELEEIFKIKIHENIILKTPYKLCDYKTIYWMLLDYFKIKYDFWGYCDMDLIFGDLSKFITDDILDKNDKIFTNGHLTLFSSNERIKNAYKLTGSKFNWNDVFSDNKIFGFDEHHGINKIWKANNLKEYSNLDIIADIDPQFKNFYLVNQPNNENKQYFAIKDGKVLQIYLKNNNIYEKEYAYIHFQKRKMIINIKDINSNNYLINNNGFSDLSKNNYENFYQFPENINIRIKRIRTVLRFYKHKILNVI